MAAKKESKLQSDESHDLSNEDLEEEVEMIWFKLDLDVEEIRSIEITLIPDNQTNYVYEKARKYLEKYQEVPTKYKTLPLDWAFGKTFNKPKNDCDQINVQGNRDLSQIGFIHNNLRKYIAFDMEAKDN